MKWTVLHSLVLAMAALHAPAVYASEDEFAVDNSYIGTREGAVLGFY